ncbi:MAG TPA: DUF4349 domain-containing protein [Armatimonadota bacterium]|nr:DUF4349 domain-containing protein [Armatimonadota bacterium]
MRWYRSAALVVLLFLTVPLMAAANPGDTDEPEVSPAGPDCTAAVVIKAPDFVAARATILAAASRHLARLLHTQIIVNAKGKKHGWLQFEMPADQLAALIPEVRAAGTLYSEHMGTANRISQFEEAGRRIEELHKHEQRLEKLLDNPRRLRGSDILYIQDRLYNAEVNQVLLEQERADLERGSRESALQVEIFEPGSLPSPRSLAVNLGQRFRSSWRLAKNDLDRRLDRAATGAAYLLVFSPLWVVPVTAVLVLTLWLGLRIRRWLRRRPRLLDLRPAWARLQPILTTGAARLTMIGASAARLTRIGGRIPATVAPEAPAADPGPDDTPAPS